METEAHTSGSTPVKREIELDFVRGIAILMVLHFHASSANLFVFRTPELPLLNFGWAGVNLFFVLSGFLVGGLLCREWNRTGGVDGVRFLKRRAFKIWPGYYALIAAYAITRKQPLHTFFWQNVLNIQNYAGTSIAHTWSLAVEEHFYLLLALVTSQCAARRISVNRFFSGMVLVAVGIAIFRTWLAATGRPYFFLTHARIDGLLLGVMLAVLLHFWPDRFNQLQSKRWILGTIIAGATATLILVPQFNASGIQVIAADAGSVAFLLTIYGSRGGQHGWFYRRVAAVGVYSYSIYLWHGSVTSPVSSITTRLGLSWLNYPGRVAAAIFFGMLMSKLLESPFLRLREMLIPARSAVPKAQSAAAAFGPSAARYGQYV